MSDSVHEHKDDSHDEHDHNHDHESEGWLRKLWPFGGHSHDYDDLASDGAFLDNKLGIRTVWWALLALTVTSVIQVLIVLQSGSVALLADTMHNIGDGLNSIPLLIAFYLARLAATRRYTYGYGKSEDVAGIFIVLSIVVSAGIIFWESFNKLLDPQPLTNLGWVAAAGVIGFIGNEAVAILQIRVGRKIGSAALIADGLHARTDGLTSLAVLVAVGANLIGFPIGDPVIGLIIGVAILFVARDATVRVWYRLMDAIDPEVLDQAEATVKKQEGVGSLRRVRLRWIGHRLHAEVVVAVDPKLSVVEGHHIAEMVRHALFHDVPRLSEIIVHVDPEGEYHSLTDGHEAVPGK